MEQLDDKNLAVALDLFAERIRDQVDAEVLQAVVAEVDHDAVNVLLTEAAQQDANEITFVLPVDGGGEIITLNTTAESHFTLPSWEETMGAGIDSMLIATPSEPSALAIFNQEHNLVVEIKHTGEVTLGKDVAPEYAAHEFWGRLAEMGGQYETRIAGLEDDVAELETDLEDAQSQVVELQEIITEIGRALDAPQATEYDLIDIAAKMKEQLEAATALIVQHNLNGTAQELPAEDPALAYQRAMKVVR